jgi:glucan 1,3-beta-glucosidase
VLTVVGLMVTSGNFGKVSLDSLSALFGLGPTPSVECLYEQPPPFEPLPQCSDNFLAGLLRSKLLKMRAEMVAARDSYPSRHSPAHAQWRARNACLRGVNVGGWLLVERWMVPPGQPIATACCGEVESPFEGLSHDEARDDYSLTQLLGQRGQLDKLRRFRESFVSRDDFAKMACLGINSVRVPFGYWIVAEGGQPGGGYYKGMGLKRLDDAVMWAEEFSISVLLDLHGAPGGQTYEQTSGREDPSWDPSRFDLRAAVQVVRTVAARYASRRTVIALELLNEPKLPAAIQLRYYKQAIAAVRGAGMAPANVAIVINLFDFNELLAEGSVWRRLMAADGLPFGDNIVIDLHLYYAFLPRLLAALPLCFVTGDLVDLQSQLLGLLGLPTLVGEWSLRVPWHGSQADQFKAMPRRLQDSLLAAFARRQIAAMTSHNASLGGYYWNWNAPLSDSQWGYQNALEHGWLEPGQWPQCPQ